MGIASRLREITFRELADTQAAIVGGPETVRERIAEFVKEFRIGNLIRDSEILELARGEAQSLVLHPPSPEILEHAVNYVRQQWQRRYGLALVG